MLSYCLIQTLTDCYLLSRRACGHERLEFFCSCESTGLRVSSPYVVLGEFHLPLSTYPFFL